MSSVQDAGKHFTFSLVLKAMWVLGAFFQALKDFRDLIQVLSGPTGGRSQQRLVFRI